MRPTLLLLLALATVTASAADWPQFHGPKRDNKSPDTGLLKTWPEGGPKLIWEANGIGQGYYQGLKQIVTAMSESIVGVRLSDGKLLWRYPHEVYADENTTAPLFHDGFLNYGINDAEGKPFYVRVERALVAHNTFINCRHTFHIGLDHSLYPPGTSPLKCTIANNLLCLTKEGAGDMITFRNDRQPMAWAWQGMYSLAPSAFQRAKACVKQIQPYIPMSMGAYSPRRQHRPPMANRLGRRSWRLISLAPPAQKKRPSAQYNISRT